MRRTLLLLCTLASMGCAEETAPGTLEILVLTAQGPSPFAQAEYVRMRVDDGESQTWPLTPEGFLADLGFGVEADGRYHQLSVEGLDADEQVVSRGTSPPVLFAPGARARLKVVPRPTEQFSSTLSGLQAPRIDFAVASDPTHGVWVVGGLDGIGETLRVEHVSPWLGDITARPDLPEGRRAPVAALTSHGAVLVALGGRTDGVFLRPGSKHWGRTWGSDVMSAVRSAAIAPAGTDSWIAAGGTDPAGGASAQTVELRWADDQLYMERGGDLLVARSRPAAIAVGDRVLVAGGSDVLMAEWLDGTPVNGSASANLTAVAVDGGALLLGDGTDAIYFVGPTGGAVLAGHLGAARRGPTATTLRDGRILVAGGDGAEATAEVIGLHDGQWVRTKAIPLTFSRTHHRAATLAEGNVLLIGGISVGNLLWLGDIYTPYDVAPRSP